MYKRQDLYSKGEVVFFNYDNIGIGVEVIVYKKDGVEYPAYCINKGRPGVTEEHEYSVSINKLVTNNKIWRAIVNGYPFKTPQELGCNNMHEAYAATKMAVYDAMYNYDLNKFTVHGDVDSNKRVVAAIKKIITAARNSKDSKKVATITVKDESKEWKVDSVDKNYLSKTYSVTASAANETYKISLENDTKKILHFILKSVILIVEEGMNMNNYYNPMQSRVDSLMQQKAMIEQQLQSLQQMNVPNININNIPSNPVPSNFDFNGKWVDGEEQARNIANNNLPLILFDNNNPVFYMKNTDGAFKKFKFEEIKEEKVENANNERMDMLEAKMDTILKALQGEPQQVQQNVPSEQKPPQNARKGGKTNG